MQTIVEHTSDVTGVPNKGLHLSGCQCFEVGARCYVLRQGSASCWSERTAITSTTERTGGDFRFVLLGSTPWGCCCKRARQTRYDNVEDLVHCLVRRGVVIRDPVVVDVLSGGLPDVTSRTLERRFRRATGLTHGAVRQIARARSAAEQLAAGVPVADVGVVMASGSAAGAETDRTMTTTAPTVRPSGRR